MDNLAADFTIENNQPLEANFDVTPNNIVCSFAVYAAGTVWGSITGELSNQTDLQEALNLKQGLLTAGNNIQIVGDVISATDTTYTAGTGISIENGIISNTQTSAEWGNIQGDIDDQTDLINLLNSKQDVISDLITIRENAQNGNSAYNTIQTYGDIVTYNAASFATSAQGSLADSALQTGDNISELVNNAGYITGIAWGDITGTLSDQTDLQTALNAKVTNNATGGNQSIALGQSSSATASGSTSLGYEANATSTYSMAIGWDALASNTNTIAIGKGAKATESGAIALGAGSENSTASSFQVGSYQLLDLTTGLIPDARISSNIARTSDIPSLSNYVTLNTAQTISSSKAFSQPLVVADNVGLASGTLLSNNKILQRTTDNTLTLNNVNNKLRFIGSETRPQYNSADLALYSDLPTLSDLTTQTQLDAINSGATSTNITQITTNTNAISDINDLIPAQATSYNQLADKEFVNSSIATNTANFIGTFNSVADLEAYSGTLTNNDYAFVIGTDAEGNTVYDRYKYTDATTPPSWVFEYELNNSSFTAAQWDAINSGITSTDVSLITTALQPNDNISTLNNDSGYITGVNWGDIGGTLTTQTDLQTALNLKADISTLATVATSGDYNDLLNKPTIPTVNDATLTIQKNGTDVATFTANSSTNQTANITVPTDNTELTNGAGYITGITSSDVTTALGYTPYDSNNPSGYTSNVGTVISVNNVSPVSGDVTLTASDVGALSDSTKYGADLSYSSNSLQLLDQDGNSLGNPVTIQSSPDIDGISITTNTDAELQTVGVIDQNNTTTAIQTWTGTRQQYDAILSKDANTLYNITDDADTQSAIQQLQTDLNGKMDVDGTNASVILPKLVLLYDGTIAKGDTITLNDDASTYDAFYATNTGQCMIGCYNSGSNKIKLWGNWCGVDSLNGGAYQQFYSIDLGDKNGNSYTVWNYSFSTVGTTTLYQISGNIKIYGVKFIGGIS